MLGLMILTSHSTLNLTSSVHRRQTFLFVGLRYSPIRKIGISKKKKKKSIFPDITTKLFVCGIVRYH